MAVPPSCTYSLAIVLARVSGYAPTPCVHLAPPPPTQMVHYHNELQLGSLRAFPTHLCDGTHLLAKIGFYNIN
jgi:hypothetical protein